MDNILGVTLTVGSLFDQVAYFPAFLYSTTYWTRTPYGTDTYLWVAVKGGYMNNNSTYKFFQGVRPVVTISESLV